MIENIEHNGATIAIIIRHEYDKPGISFFTPDSFSQQLAYMHHPKGKVIAPHVHNPVLRQVSYTQEVLYIKSGQVRVDLYDNDKAYFKSTYLNKGDVILLAAGGHGFEAIEDLQMIEIKQGPYAGDQDKTHFAPVPADNIKVG